MKKRFSKPVVLSGALALVLALGVVMSSAKDAQALGWRDFWIAMYCGAVDSYLGPGPSRGIDYCLDKYMN